jgi:DNA repair exonuclease SbcCD ATPase subunit
MTNTIQSSIRGLVKVAEQMVDAVESQQTVGPDEAYDALENIISELEALAQSIPSSGGQEQKPEEKTPNPIAGAPQEKDPRVASLEKEVKRLTSEIDTRKREEIAQEFASYFNDPKEAKKQADAILTSKDSIEVLQAKLNTIAEYAESNDVSPTKHAQEFSLQRVARLAETRMHTL